MSVVCACEILWVRVNVHMYVVCMCGCGCARAHELRKEDNLECQFLPSTLFVGPLVVYPLHIPG